MKGLLFKDLCNLRQVAKQSLLVLAILAAWCFFIKSTQIFSMMTIVYSMMLLFTVMTYDEWACFDKYALTLPITRSDLVRSRYLLLLLLFLAGIVVGIAGGGLISLLTQENASWQEQSTGLWEQAVSLLAVACVYFLAFCILLPITFRFGMERARLLLALIFVAAFALLYGVISLADVGDAAVTEGMVYGALAAGAVLTAAGFFISCWISVRIVQKKEW